MNKLDLVRELREEAYARHDVCSNGRDVEETTEWRAAVEIEAWRAVMPQYEFRDGAIRRRPESLPPFNAKKGLNS